MRGVSCKQAQRSVVELPTPKPERGQLLVDVLRCGICGSDLHARHNSAELAAVADEVGYDGMMRPDQSVILGHEICGEVVGYGPGCRRAARVGERIVALPLLRRGTAGHPIGLSSQ